MNKPNNTTILKSDNSSTIKVKKVRNGIGVILLILGIMLTLYYIYGLTNRISFNFKKLGDDFSKSNLYKLHLIRDDYGLKREDYIDFDINIRTDDGIADCKINGRTREEGLEYVDVRGSSEICQNLKH